MFLHFCEIILMVFDRCDLVHDVETIHGLS